MKSLILALLICFQSNSAYSKDNLLGKVEKVYAFHAKKNTTLRELNYLLKGQNLLSSVHIEFDCFIDGKNISPIPFKQNQSEGFFILRFRASNSIHSILYKVDFGSKTKNNEQKLLWIVLGFYQPDNSGFGGVDIKQAWLNPWDNRGNWIVQKR